MADDAEGVSDLLRSWGRGDVQARDRLIPLVYQELKRRAAAYLRHERPDHSLQPTALVHEAYLRLIGQERVAWQNRAHFFAIAAQMMRRIVVDQARARQTSKRGGDGLRVELDDQIAAATSPLDLQVLQLDEALDALAALDARQAQIVEMRYFAGMAEHEVAVALSLSRATVTREWQAAKAWLFRHLNRQPLRHER